MSEDSAPSISATFSLAGRDFDPDECTRTLGITPTKIWRPRRPDLLVQAGLNTLAWYVEQAPTPLYSTDDAVRPVLDIVYPRRVQIREFARDHQLTTAVVCAIKSWGRRAVLELLPDTVSRLSELGASFSIDLYDYSDRGAKR